MTASVLHSQERLLSASTELREAKKAVAELEERVSVLTENHREQIRKSLVSKDAKEREMAEGVAAWYQVELPKI